MEDVWTGAMPVLDVLHRIPGLLTVPYSRFRAAYFEAHPPEDRGGDSGSDVPGWLGWDGNTSYLVTLINVVISAVGGKKSKGSLLKYPSSRSQQAQPRTIAEFIQAARRNGLHVQDHG